MDQEDVVRAELGHAFVEFHHRLGDDVGAVMAIVGIINRADRSATAGDEMSVKRLPQLHRHAHQDSEAGRFLAAAVA